MSSRQPLLPASTSRQTLSPLPEQLRRNRALPCSNVMLVRLRASLPYSLQRCNTCETFIAILGSKTPTTRPWPRMGGSWRLHAQNLGDWWGKCWHRYEIHGGLSICRIQCKKPCPAFVQSLNERAVLSYEADFVGPLSILHTSKLRIWFLPTSPS